MRYILFVLSFLISTVSYPQYIYVSSDKDEIYRLDLAGNCTSTFFSQCNPSNSAITDIAVDAFGKLYICRNDSVFLVDNSGTGCVFITSFGNYHVKSIEVGPDGKLYAADRYLLRYNFATGQLINLGELPQNMPPAGDLIFYLTRLYLSTATGSIYELNINDPASSQVYFDSKIFNLTGIVVVPARCFNALSDELRVFAFENSGNNQTFIHIIDMEKKIVYRNYCSLNLTVTGNSGFHPATVVTGQIGSISFITTPATCNKTADGRIGINMNNIPVDINSYSFSLNNGAQNSTGIFTNLQSGNYRLSIANKMGCSKDTLITVPVLATDCLDSLFVPTAFTPNADGNNDLFRVRSYVPYNDFQMLVFDRNGQEIFQSTSMLKGWDGKNKGVLQNTGIYIWQIKYRNLEGQSVYRKGLVVLIH